ncbi:MAG: Zn-ribbon domain-containing OB-fold protein [Chloroflexi bacterium]|nr:Zn-ribbon domain-containing OB-fold protein [Chloroflexota bacterium]
MDKPLPVITPTTEPFWRACAEGRLLLRRCQTCGSLFHYPRQACPSCWSEALEWRESSGRGAIWSFSQVHVALGGDAWKDELPYTVVIVELDEGVRMLSRLVGSAADEPAVGDRVQVEFFRQAEGVCLPYFRLER